MPKVEVLAPTDAAVDSGISHCTVFVGGRAAAVWDVDPATLVVPAVGRVELRPGASPPAVIIDPDGNEVALATQGIRLAALTSRTALAYMYALLGFFRWCWSLGIDPQFVTTPQYLLYRNWLQHRIALPPPVRKAQRKRKAGPLRRNRKPGIPARPRGQYRPGDDISRHISSSTAMQAESAIRTVYRGLTQGGLLLANPIPRPAAAARVEGRSPLEAIQSFRRGHVAPHTVPPLTRIPPRRIDLISERLQERLYHAPHVRNRAFFTASLQAGPRIGELLSLTPEHLDEREGVMWLVGKGLNGERRPVPVTDIFLDEYATYVEWLAIRGVTLRRGTAVWRSIRSPHQPVGYHAMREQFRTHLGPTGAAHGPHAMRHTAATYMLEALGLPIHQVQQILGHVNAATTSVYLHADERKAANDFRKAWATPRRAEIASIPDDLDPELRDALAIALGDD